MSLVEPKIDHVKDCRSSRISARIPTISKGGELWSIPTISAGAPNHIKTAHNKTIPMVINVFVKSLDLSGMVCRGHTDIGAQETMSGVLQISRCSSRWEPWPSRPSTSVC
jgi:hypothetical protein